MMVAELIKSCSHARVAEAAIHSIGPDLAREVGHRARECGLDAGDYVARSVQGFAGSARPQEWRSLAARLEGVDMPILTGLHYILELCIAQEMGLSVAPQEQASFRLPNHERLAQGRNCCI
jgi:hypothetical protein